MTATKTNKFLWGWRFSRGYQQIEVISWDAGEDWIIGWYNRKGRRLLGMLTIPTTYAGCMDYYTFKDCIMGYIRKIDVSCRSEVANQQACDVDLARECPAVHEYMTAIRDDEGKSRKTATCLIFADQGTFKMVLNERQQGVSLWVAADHVAALWERMEGLLTQEKVPWRINQEQVETKKKK